MREANLLADASGVKSGAALDRILADCWLETTNSGPYSFDGRPVWDEVALGDRLVALLQIRVATYGPEYSFPVRCDACSTKFVWEVDLVDDLERVPFSEEAIRALRSGSELSTVVGGRTYHYRVQLGRDEKAARKVAQQKSEERVTAALAQRITRVEGVEGLDLRRFLSDLPLGDMRKLLSALDATGGGVETEIGVRCSSCANEMDVELPFTSGFFLPPK